VRKIFGYTAIHKRTA